MVSKKYQDKLSRLRGSMRGNLNQATQGKSNNDTPGPRFSQGAKEPGAIATKERKQAATQQGSSSGSTSLRGGGATSNPRNRKIPKNEKDTGKQPRHAGPAIPLNLLKRFMNDSDGIKVFRKNYSKYLDDNQNIKGYPDLLDSLPALPDIAPVIRKYFTPDGHGPTDFDNQLRGMLDRVDMEDRHDFSLMVAQYNRTAINEIAAVGNSRIYKNYPSLVDFKKHYGNERITRSSLLFAILGGIFRPDTALRKRYLGAILDKHRRNSRIVLKDLLSHRTLTPNNYKWSDQDTTTFNLPSNFGAVITIAIIKYLTNEDGFFAKPSLQDMIEHDADRSYRSKSLSKNYVYQDLQKHLNLRLVINTKLQRVLFDELQAHTINDVKR